MATVGLLPLYISLYDEKVPYLRPRLERFYSDLAGMLELRGLKVLRSPFCRVEREFAEAIGRFEAEGAQALVTVHMAYSPSLESSGPLARTELPIVVLDVTETHGFGSGQDPSEIEYSHGIHGVMDMCSLLRRNGKRFAIAAGHPAHSDVIDRAVGYVRAAVAASSLGGSKVGSIGGPFEGMGDFAVSDGEMLGRFGVTVVHAGSAGIGGLLSSVTDAEIDSEMGRDLKEYRAVGAIPPGTHRESLRNDLAVRRWLEAEGLSAFSVNFLKVGPETGLTTMPFLEACKAMARGVGYAGEGDVLTASFVGALSAGFGEVSFVEVFCPDWKGGTLLLSHMGEVNASLTARRPELLEKPFVFGDGRNPVGIGGCLKGGEAAFVNVCKGAGGFRLVISPVAMAEEDGDGYVGLIRGWMRPCKPVGRFLEDLSQAGATHHSALAYGARTDSLRFFGELLGLEVVEI